jgi:hypothetical protein
MSSNVAAVATFAAISGTLTTADYRAALAYNRGVRNSWLMLARSDNVNNMAFGAPMISEIARIVLNDP